jgi:TetR/AcrR family transcriptional repressor of mexJK operon
LEKKDQIFRAAQLLFAQFGLKKVTTDDIATEARVSKATLYKYYANKSEVFDDVVKREADQLMTSIREAVESEAETVAKLRAHLVTRLGRVHEFVNFYRVTQESWGDYWPFIAGVRRKFLQAEKDLVKEILQGGMRAGDLALRQVDLSAHVLVIALTSLEFQWSLKELEMPLPVLADGMLEMMIDGIRKR